MPIRWGIVTASKICNDFVNAFNTYPDKGDAVIAAIAARDKKKATEFAKLHKIPEVFGSYKEMAESKDIDVAYIGSILPHHYELAKLFLDNGKHVLCEKPFCMNSKQVISLVNLARKKNLFLMEAIWSRFSPAYIALEKEIQVGKLGEIKYVEANYGVPISDIDRICKKELGGSAFLDLGVYALQFAQYIFKDEPLKCTAIGKLNADGVDEVNHVILEYSGDRRAVMNITSTVQLWNKATVYGTTGRATVEAPFHFSTVINVDGKVQKFPLHTSDINYNFDNSAGLVYEALEVARCIKEGLIESPRMPHKDSILIAKLEDSVRNQVGVVYDADSEEFP